MEMVVVGGSKVRAHRQNFCGRVVNPRKTLTGMG